MEIYVLLVLLFSAASETPERTLFAIPRFLIDRRDIDEQSHTYGTRGKLTH